MDLNLPASVVLIARLLATFTPSYIHPDEHFQGPQVIAAVVFGWDLHKTWEFTANRPIRSAASLWTVYAPVMYPWKYIVGSNVGGFPLYFALRLWFVLLTYVFVDRSLPDIVGSTERVQLARFLLNSSYAFLVYQSHTFSNSIESILVIQTLVLCTKLSRSPTLRTPARFALLGILVAYGIFNRPTFPFWILVPLLSLLFHLSLRDVFMMSAAIVGFLMTTAMLITGDTYYYLGRIPALGDFLPSTARVVITPLNNVLYNADVANLALHGIHNRLTHLLVNLPSLIGPPLILIFTQRPHNFLAIVTAFVGVLGLSFFPHQEARFLLPAVPLLLSSIRLPLASTRRRLIWILRATFAFNITLGLLMGVYHQGGVVRAQQAVSRLSQQSLIDGVIWWKTYPPPDWILGSQAGKFHVHDLMGAEAAVLEETVRHSIKCVPWTPRKNFLLVMPLSTKELASYFDPETGPFHVTQAFSFNTHLNLDDMDFPIDGIIATITRVIGRRGLGVFNIHKHC